jgi:hypothetical protein
MEVMLGMQEQFQVRGHDDAEVVSLLVVELAMPAYAPKRREKQAKSFVAPIFPRTLVARRDPVEHVSYTILDLGLRPSCMVEVLKTQELFSVRRGGR